MRHNKKINHLGRTSSHRNAMLANMCISLIREKRIFTTVAKAKALRKVIEPIITKSKDDTTHSRRLVFQDLMGGQAAKFAVQELFQDIAQKVADRPGGYTRIIKTEFRLGDNAAMCFIELVDYNENMQKAAKADAKPKTRRSRRGTGAKATEAAAETVVAEKEAAPKAKKAAAPKAKAEETQEAPKKDEE